MNSKTFVDCSPFLHLFPLFDSEQTQRYQRIKQTSNQLHDLTKLVGNYISIGQKFSSAILELYTAITSIDVVAVNSSYSSICESMTLLNTILMNHLNLIESSMLIPIQSFIRHDISLMKKAKNQYFTINEKFIELNDKLLTTSKTKLTDSDKFQKLIELHKDSSHSFCEYVLQLDVTESRYESLICTLILNYYHSIKDFVGHHIQDFFDKCNPKTAFVNSEINKFNENITTKMFYCSDIQARLDQELQNYYILQNQHFNQTLQSIQGFLWKKSSAFSMKWEKLFCVCHDGFFAASQSPATCAHPLWTFC